MTKLNDYFLNLLNNPTFSPYDFTLVGLSIDNTSLEDKNVYLNSDYIKNLDIFKTNDVFDQTKFDNFYDYAQKGITHLAKLKEVDDLGNSWRAYRNDISSPEYLRDYSPQFKIEKVMNPLRLQEGFVTYGLKENPTQSIREIAESLHQYDTESKTWKESPNDKGILGFVDNVWNPKVLASWDFDADENGNPTSDPNKIVYHKGERKLNANGTYYYEDLGDRPVYGKEVLGAFDTLTTDGSFWNKLDFLDSDDIEKSGRGSLMRAAAQIVPAFIPGVNTWYIGARVGLGATQVLPVVGKMLAGLTGENANNKMLSKLEALDKALSFSLSDYVLGSQMDNGLVLQDSHLWSFETAFKLIADVFTQLAEQRWLFEKSAQVLSGLSKEVITDPKALSKWIEEYIGKSLDKELTTKEIIEGLARGEDVAMVRRMQQASEWQRAQNLLTSRIKGALELAGKLSMTYMTGITTASSYGEMKQQGATDLEAALFTLGYSLAEFGLLNTEMGRWILPELKQERTHMGNIAATYLKPVREAWNDINKNSDIGKAKAFSKIINLGRDAYNNNLGKSVTNQVAGTIISNMGAEAMEETSEELLLDLAKVFYNEAASMAGGNFKFNDAFSNVFDRYAMSFIGGAIGGGIAGVLSGSYRQAKLDLNMTQEQATKEIVDYIQQGKDLELINVVNKGTWANKYMDQFGNQVSDYTKSVDFMVKQNFANLVNTIKDILTTNGANLSKEELLGVLTPRDIKYGQLSALALEKSNSIAWYINRFNDVSSRLVKNSLKLKELKEPNYDQKYKQEELKEENKEEIRLLEEQIKEDKKIIDSFNNGDMADEFMLDAVFEMTNKISGFYVSNFEQWAEDEYNKSIDEFTEGELIAAKKKFDEIKPFTRDLIHKYRQVHITNMEWLSKMMTEYDETYFKNKNATIENLSDILFGNRQQINYNLDIATTPEAQWWLDKTFLKEFQEGILKHLDQEKFGDLVKRFKEATDENITLSRIVPDVDFNELTYEKLKDLTEEQKNKIATYLWENVPFFDSLIEDYYKLVKDADGNDVLARDENGNPILDINLLKADILKEDVKLLNKQTEDFNQLFINFLINDDVKLEIINKLKSAKYILPSLKVALDEFFDNNLSYTDEAGEPNDDGSLPKISLNKKTIEEYKNSYKDLPSSPVDLYLLNVVRTLKGKGVNFVNTVFDLDQLIFKLALAKNLESFVYDENVERLIRDALLVMDFAEVGLDSAASTIIPDLSDVSGFNALVNNIRQNKGDKKHLKLALIDSDIAQAIKMDIQRYRETLIYYRNLFNYNSNSILNEHDKTYQVQSVNLYDKLYEFVSSIEVPDWKELDKLKEALESSEIKEAIDLIKDGKADNTLEFKIKLTKARMNMDRAVHDFFLKNENAPLEQLIKTITIDFVPGDTSYTSLNGIEKALPNKDFLWYLAMCAAVDPDILMNEYQSGISADYAPVIGLEEAIKKALAFLINRPKFELFAEAYNLNILASWNEKNKEWVANPSNISLKKTTAKEDNKLANTLVNAYRSIFIEGMPGSGKSTAVIDTLLRILEKHHKDVLSKIVIVSNSKENARRLTTSLHFDPENTLHFSIDEFRHKILNNYSTPTVSKEGVLEFGNDDTKVNPPSGRVYNKATVNSESLDATLLIIDEATSLTQMDTFAVDLWLETKKIAGIYAGDFDQLGATGEVTNSQGHKVSISQVATNYITTHKLGLVIRGNNKYKSDNIVSLEVNKRKFIQSLMSVKSSADASPEKMYFLYYIDDTGLYGDCVFTPDQKVNESGTELMLDLATKDTIDKMINSLEEGEKINFIFDDVNSILYKYLEENYKDKINKISTNASQSLEGLYYIVDIALQSGFKLEDRVKAEKQFLMLYTAISRAKLGTLIFDRNDVINSRFNSTKLDKLVRTIISLDARTKYATERQEAILAAINPGTASNFEKLVWDESEEPVEKPEPKDSDDTEGEATNEPYEPDIKNDEEGKLYMMVHTFNCHEIGGTIDENGNLVLGEHYEDRIDNAHGIIKLLQSINGFLYKINVSDDGKVSVEGIDADDSIEKTKEFTQKLLSLIDRIRSAATYGNSNNTIVSSIVNNINNIFGTKIKNSDILVRFIYKNSSENGELNLSGKRGPLYKFFKGAKDVLRHMFTKEKDPEKLKKQETPSNHTIGLEIILYNNNPKLRKQIEIPIGTFTNPATLIRSKGFEQLAQIYDQLRDTDGSTKLISFYKELKKPEHKNVPHINEMLKLLEINLWNMLHNKAKNFVIRFEKDFVLNQGSDKITGIQVPPTNPETNPSGARGKGYVDKDFYYPGRPVTLEEYRREMPSRNITSLFEGVNGNFVNKDGKIFLKKGAPFVLMSDAYPDASKKELYERYMKLELEGGPKLVTRVYVNFPKKGLDYFLWNLLEAFKKAGSSARASDIDFHIGNKLTSYRLLKFMLKEDSNFMTAYKNFAESILSDPHIKIDVENFRKYTFERIERLLSIMNILSKYEESLTDKHVSTNVGENGLLSKVLDVITARKQLLNFLDLNIETLKDDPNFKELYKLFIPDGSLNPNNTDLHQRPIGNTKYSIRTALQFEFRRLLLGNFLIEDGKNPVYPLTAPYGNHTTEIVREGENYVFLDFQKDRIEALKEDMENNKWDGILTRTSLKRGSELAYSHGGNIYKIVELVTEDDGFISNESVEFNGKLPSTAIILDINPMMDEILNKAVVIYGSKEQQTIETSERLSSKPKSEKLKIYRNNMGGYLEGRFREEKEEKDVSSKLNNIKGVLAGNPSDEVITIISNYLKNNDYDEKEPTKDLLIKIFGNNDKFGLLEVSGNGNSLNTYRIYKLKSNQKIILRDELLAFFYQDEKGVIYKMVPNENNGTLADYTELIKYKTQIPQEIENYAQVLVKDRNNYQPTLKEGDKVTINNKEVTVKKLDLDDSGNLVYITEDSTGIEESYSQDVLEKAVPKELLVLTKDLINHLNDILFNDPETFLNEEGDVPVVEIVENETRVNPTKALYAAYTFTFVENKSDDEKVNWAEETDRILKTKTDEDLKIELSTLLNTDVNNVEKIINSMREAININNNIKCIDI